MAKFEYVITLDGGKQKDGKELESWLEERKIDYTKKEINELEDDNIDLEMDQEPKTAEESDYNGTAEKISTWLTKNIATQAHFAKYFLKKKQRPYVQLAKTKTVPNHHPRQSSLGGNVTLSFEQKTTGWILEQSQTRKVW